MSLNTANKRSKTAPDASIVLSLYLTVAKPMIMITIAIVIVIIIIIIIIIIIMLVVIINKQ